MTVYEKDFKEEAVKLSYETGTRKAAEQLGVPASTLTGWRNAMKEHKAVAFVGSGNQRIIPTNAKEIQLMKKIKELERANRQYIFTNKSFNIGWK